MIEFWGTYISRFYGRVTRTMGLKKKTFHKKFGKKDWKRRAFGFQLFQIKVSVKNGHLVTLNYQI
jgi:hypothetical protein